MRSDLLILPHLRLRDSDSPAFPLSESHMDRSVPRSHSTVDCSTLFAAARSNSALAKLGPQAAPKERCSTWFSLRGKSAGVSTAGGSRPHYGPSRTADTGVQAHTRTYERARPLAAVSVPHGSGLGFSSAVQHPAGDAQLLRRQGLVAAGPGKDFGDDAVLEVGE